MLVFALRVPSFRFICLLLLRFLMSCFASDFCCLLRFSLASSSGGFLLLSPSSLCCCSCCFAFSCCVALLFSLNFIFQAVGPGGSSMRRGPVVSQMPWQQTRMFGSGPDQTSGQGATHPGRSTQQLSHSQQTQAFWGPRSPKVPLGPFLLHREVL